MNTVKPFQSTILRRRKPDEARSRRATQGLVGEYVTHTIKVEVAAAARLSYTICAPICGPSPALPRPFLRPHCRKSCECAAQGGRDDELSDILTRSSWARPLLTAVMYVQLGTSCPTSWTISDREQAIK